MTLTPFRGRCHTCGHDHDAEGQTLHDILTTIEQGGRAAADRIEALEAERDALLAEQWKWQGMLEREAEANGKKRAAMAERDAMETERRADRAAMQQAVEALTLAGEKMPLDQSWTDRDAIAKARIAALAALRERLK